MSEGHMPSSPESSSPSAHNFNNPSQRTGIHLKEFFVFNPTFGNDHDDELGKVLYYYPSTTHVNTQLKKVGLCEAIIRFTQNFNSELPCESLHTQKARYVFLQPEPDYWWTMVLEIPTVIKMSPEGLRLTEYHNDQVQDSVIQSLLWKLYYKFILLNDKLSHWGNQLEKLKELLKSSLDVNLRKLDVNTCGITDIFRGIQFLPLDRAMFLKVQCFINLLSLQFEQISHCILLQSEKLIWSGVGQSDIQILYDYLTKDVLLNQFLTGTNLRSTHGFIQTDPVTVYLTQDRHRNRNNLNSQDPNEIDSKEPEDEHASSDESFVTASGASPNSRRESRIGCGSSCPKSNSLLLLIYKTEQSYLCLLLRKSDGSSTVTPEFLRNLEEFLSLSFTPLAKILGRDFPSSTTSGTNVGSSSNPEAFSPSTKFIYFNNLNLAEKTTPGYQIEQNSYKMLADLKDYLSCIKDNGEITVKMVSDAWIVAKISNGRELYTVFNTKGANLLEIDEELKKLTESQLSNIFFQD